jgi:hypothetical protein
VASQTLQTENTEYLDNRTVPMPVTLKLILKSFTIFITMFNCFNHALSLAAIDDEVIICKGLIYWCSDKGK